MAFYPPQGSCQELVLTTNTQLDYPYSANTSNLTVTDMIDVSATISNLKLFLPNSTLTGPGFSVTFNNVGTNSFDVVLNDGVTVLTTVGQGDVITVYLYSNSNANGNWRVISFGSGVNAISTLDIASSNSSIIVANGVITPPGGTIDVTLPPLISTIETFGGSSVGLVIIDSSESPYWGVVSLNNDSNITITNPDGKTGAPSIGLNSSIDVVQITSGNIIITNNTITNTNVATTLTIVSNGASSKLTLNGMVVDISSNLTCNNLTLTGTFQSPSVPKAWCRFSNTSNTINTQSTFNVSSVNFNIANGQYTINFTTPMENTDYTIFINCSNNNSTPPLQTRIGYDIIKNTNSVVIVLADGAGEMLSDIPEGVSVMIMSI